MRLGGDARFDFGWFDAVCSTLALNAHASGPTGETVRVLRLASFVNHAEDPNARLADVPAVNGLGGVHVDAGGLSLERKHVAIVATRDIEPGEEITIGYFHEAAPAEERQAIRRRFLLDDGDM